MCSRYNNCSHYHHNYLYLNYSCNSRHNNSDKLSSNVYSRNAYRPLPASKHVDAKLVVESESTAKHPRNSDEESGDDDANLK